MCRHTDAISSSTDISKGREVLPKNVKPLHYDLTLEPNLETCKYTGSVSIDLDVIEPTTSISLNTIDLEIQKSEIYSGSKLISSSPKVSYVEDTQTTTFTLNDSEKIPAGEKIKLNIEFTGFLNDVLAGFYRASYVGKDGSKKYMATTQMEPTDARRAFPCFDEPALKANFTVTLVADKDLTCLSNMDVKSEKEVDSKAASGKKKAVTFNTTPLMSTYLLAFIVGEFNVVESNSFRVPVRVFAAPDQNIEHGRFSAELGAKTLDFYEKAFDSKFPLPKMDMIAIPDFAAGAMENWGLVTYRVVDLLFNEKTSGASTKQRVAEVVQHELAHQWFGNLVTMDFWEGLWLNEGFATWMSWYSCNEFYPEWKVWETYVTDNLQAALSLDSLRSSHPVEVPVKRADEINQIFDSISYAKGSSVLRMISKWLGEETFLEGVRRYLKKHAYGNTQTSDLWNALTDASGKDVENVMQIWTKNIGFPVVSVTEEEGSKSMQIKQNRFLRTNDVKPEEDKTLYPVMLALRTKEGVDEEATLFDRERTMKIPEDDFFKLNTDHSGLYRTFYSSSRLRKLGEAAKEGRLSVEDRAGMIADAGALAAAGLQRSSGTMSLLKGFSKEDQFVVWDEITAWLGSIRAAWIFEEDNTRTALRTFSRELVSDKAHSLGWTFQEGEDNIQQQFKALMFASAGGVGDTKIIGAAQEMFKKFVDGDRDAIHPNIRGGVYSIVLEHGGEAEYNAILNEYRTASTSDERNAALRSLGRTREPKLIQRTIDLAFDNSEVRTQDLYMPLGGLRTHPNGIKALWQAIKNEWPTLVRRMPATLSMLGDIVQMGTASFTKPEQMEDVKSFFATKNTKGFDRSLNQAMDAMKAKQQWIARDGEDVVQWLKKEGYYR